MSFLKIDTFLALEKYELAEQKAEEKAKNAKKRVYGADEIAEELELLLAPMLMEANLLDQKEFSRIEKLINTWCPDHLGGKEMAKCGGVQQVLLAMLPIYRQQQQIERIKVLMGEYEQHLLKKIKENTDESSSSEKQKLEAKRSAISGLYSHIKEKKSLETTDKERVKFGLSACLKMSDWSERPFLQRLTDVLSFGFKPLYRAFFSKESLLEKELSQSLDVLKLGK